MQFLYTVIAFTSLAVTGSAAPIDAAPLVEARQTAASPCESNQHLVWRTGSEPGFKNNGGWECLTDNKGGCRVYLWTTDLPYYSCLIN
ncbi:hypothetical protein CGCF415_v006787 [Colletotrichum fructicola]|nr:uncharacterized protein CGMCC3_g1657 [Colletotrichum fructicola]KAE9582396.1 hypothetical protein CGMCC3_g1657 [Colletotrichum fructicola]KAF4895956.1 hypothetical protein CGCFRS4_v005714 [Colletotrichum fructicola]KAF4908180.1 hypothetical protein CGCF415_v006787 [Colletotrichum fructicola]KAF4939783.1 hypothetical protein CGCF245_v003377 [Colletotrichum fructicola]